MQSVSAYNIGKFSAINSEKHLEFILYNLKLNLQKVETIFWF